LFVDQAIKGVPRFTDQFLVVLGGAPIVISKSARVTAGDINGDGRFDLVLGNGAQALFYPNVGSNNAPRFVAGWKMELGDLVQGAGDIAPYLSDFNGDGSLDLLTGTTGGIVSVHTLASGVSPLSNQSIAVSGYNNRATHFFSVSPNSGKKWQNQSNRFDVDSDGVVNPLDVLVLIDHINSNAGNPLDFQKPYFDVDGDDIISPLDALQLINHLNSGGQGEGESEEVLGSAAVSNQPIQTMELIMPSEFYLPISFEDSISTKRRRPARGFNLESIQVDTLDSIVADIANDVTESRCKCILR
jgi:hypothetical protein